jgi:hypothetical protein
VTSVWTDITGRPPPTLLTPSSPFFHSYKHVYTYDNDDSCGHIFCKTCLAALEQPSTCPLCRKPFALDKVKKLIVDRVSSTSDENQAMGGGRDEASVLLEQIALVSGEETPADQAAQVLSGAQQWLEVQPEAPSVSSCFSLNFPLLIDITHSTELSKQPYPPSRASATPTPSTLRSKQTTRPSNTTTRRSNGHGIRTRPSGKALKKA